MEHHNLEQVFWSKTKRIGKLEWEKNELWEKRKLVEEVSEEVDQITNSSWLQEGSRFDGVWRGKVEKVGIGKFGLEGEIYIDSVEVHVLIWK